jgi:RNA polymerase sigma factor (sigma-70 family)
MTAFSAEELGKHANALRALARDLIADEALAEDAVQDACVTALTKPPVGSLAGWLRTVVSNRVLELRRSEQRRRRREQMAARSEASEDADAAGRLELQQDILAAVRSLEAPYRAAVWMRYYEHRTPSQIAKTLGDPVKTVKTRLWRALQLLRQKLDHRYGDRRAWLGALVPLAKLSGRTWGLGAAVAAGALWMQAKPLLVATILGLALVAGGAWVWSGGGAPPVPLPSLSEVKAHVAPQPVADACQSRQVAEVEAVAAKSPEAAASVYGSLAVRVRWHDDRPAPGIAIYCDVRGEPQLDRNELCVVSDEAGLARAAHVHAGKVKLSSERGGELEANVAAGTQHEVDFVLPRGIDVTGIVRDQRQLPVAGAEVVLVSPRGGWLGGRTVAVTDAVGAFAVRAVDAT